MESYANQPGTVKHLHGCPQQYNDKYSDPAADKTNALDPSTFRTN